MLSVDESLSMKVLIPAALDMHSMGIECVETRSYLQERNDYNT